MQVAPCAVTNPVGLFFSVPEKMKKIPAIKIIAIIVAIKYFFFITIFQAFKRLLQPKPLCNESIKIDSLAFGQKTYFPVQRERFMKKFPYNSGSI